MQRTATNAAVWRAAALKNVVTGSPASSLTWLIEHIPQVDFQEGDAVLLLAALHDRIKSSAWSHTEQGKDALEYLDSARYVVGRAADAIDAERDVPTTAQMVGEDSLFGMVL